MRFTRTVPVANPMGEHAARHEVGFQTIMPNELTFTLTRDASKKAPQPDDAGDEDIADKRAAEPVPRLSFSIYSGYDDKPLEIIPFPLDSVVSRRDDFPSAPEERRIAQRAYGFFHELEQAVEDREKAQRAQALEEAHRIFTNMPPKS